MPTLCPACAHVFGPLDSPASTQRCPNCGTEASPDEKKDTGGGTVLTVDDDATGPDHSAPPARSDLPSVPGYEVVGELGRGGMGVVFKARQVGLNRVVALKMIRASDLPGPDEIDRFQAEAEAAARLQHPNIVQIYEIGTENGQPHFSLEYVEGGTLRQHLGGNPQGPTEAARLLETLARAVHAAHERGVVHRDLKPANILLARPSVPAEWPLTLSQYVPKITDFGLAKRLDTDITRTTTGVIVGTPAYMAPEQAAARSKEIGPATDVWALGAILYDVLTGRPPFKGATTRDTLDLVLHTEPVSPRRLQPGVPTDLETICLKCLQKDPARRYASALDLAEDLRRFTAGEPITARPVGKLEQAWRFCLRKPYVAAVILLGTCLAVGSPIVALVINADRNALAKQTRIANEMTDEANTKRSEAELATHRANDESKKATAAAANERIAAANEKAAAAKEKRAREETQLALADRNKALIETRVRLYHSTFSLAERRWQAGDVSEAQRLLKECPEEHRGFEWHYLNRLCKPELLSLSGTGGSQASFTKSGRHLIIGTGLHDYGRVGGEKVKPKPRWAVWCWATGKRIHESISNYDYQLSDGGECLVYVKRKDEKDLYTPTGQVIVLNGFQGTTLFTVPGEGHIAGLSKDGRLLAVSRTRPRKDGDKGPPDTDLEVFDIAAKKSVLTLKGASAPAVFSPTGRHLTAPVRLAGEPAQKGMPPASERRVWEVPSGKEVLRQRVEGYSPATQFSPGGTLLLITQQSSKLVGKGYVPQGSVTLWDLREGKTVFSDPLPSTQAEFSADGRAVLVRRSDGPPTGRPGSRLILWGSATGQKLFDRRAPATIRFSRDGKRLVWMGETAAQACDALTGRVVKATGGDQELINASLFGPDAPITTYGDIGRLWVTAGGRQLISVPSGVEMGWGGGPRGRVAVSPDGKLVALASQRLDKGGYRSLEVWEVATGKLLRTYKEPGAHYTCVAFSPDGSRLAGAGNSNVIKLWDVSSGQEVGQLRGHMGLDITDPEPLPRGIERLTFSPDGLALVSEGRGQVKIWDLFNPPGQTQLQARGDIIFNLSFNQSGNRLWETRNDDEPVRGGRFHRAYDTATGAVLHEAQNPAWQSAWFSPEGRWAVTRTYPRAQPKGRTGPPTLQVYDARTWQPHVQMAGAATDFDSEDRRAVVYTPPADPKGRWQAKLWDVPGKKELFPLPDWASLRTTPFPFRPDGKVLVYPREGGLIAMVKAADGQPLYEVAATLPELRYVFSPDSARFVTLKGESLELRDSHDGKIRLTLALKEPLAVFDFWEDGKKLTAVGRKGAVRVWDTQTGQELTTLSLGPGDNRLFGRGTRILRSTTTRRKVNTREVEALEVRCWDLRTGHESVTKIDHRQAFQGAVTFSNDGRRLACIRGQDSAVEVWDLASGQLILTFPGTPMPLRRQVAFSPDGRRLVAGGSDLMLYDGAEPPPGQETARLEAVAQFRLHAHTQEINRALQQGEKLAALFHIDRLLALQPTHPQLRPIRAGLQAERGIWDDAALDLSLALRSPSARPTLLPQYAVALYRSGDVAGWKRLCEQLVARNSESKNALLLDSVLRACLIAPGALKDQDRLEALADKLGEAVPNKGYSRMMKGMTLARVGQHKKALAELQEVAKLIKGQEENLPEYLFFLAMAQHAEKQPQEALATLQKARRYVHRLKTFPDIPMLFRRPDWDALARYDLLVEETAALLGEGAK